MEPLSCCKECLRLVDFLTQTKQQYPHYFCQPVPSFGNDNAQLLIIGLAPGLHGANATGRPFTGDDSGGLLFSTLYKFGFSSLDNSLSINDGLQLNNCKIINAVKCLPPNNKPSAQEIKSCNHFLKAELKAPNKKTVILCLGQIAHKAVLKAKNITLKKHPFSHHAVHHLSEGITLIDSYHCGRYNTQTKRLTIDMFHDVFKSINQYL